jgi:hypothetical protein
MTTSICPFSFDSWGVLGFAQKELNDNLIERVVHWAEVYRMPVSPTPDVGIIEQDLAYNLYTSAFNRRAQRDHAYPSQRLE